MPYVCLSNKKQKIGVAMATMHHNDAPPLVTSQTRTLVGILYDLEVEQTSIVKRLLNQ